MAVCVASREGVLPAWVGSMRSPGIFATASLRSASLSRSREELGSSPMSRLFDGAWPLPSFGGDWSPDGATEAARDRRQLDTP